MAFSVLVALATGIKCYRTTENHTKKSTLDIMSLMRVIHYNSVQDDIKVRRIHHLKGSWGKKRSNCKASTLGVGDHNSLSNY